MSLKHVARGEVKYISLELSRHWPPPPLQKQPLRSLIVQSLARNHAPGQRAPDDRMAPWREAGPSIGCFLPLTRSPTRYLNLAIEAAESFVPSCRPHLDGGTIVARSFERHSSSCDAFLLALYIAAIHIH